MAEMQPLTQQDIKALQAYLDAMEELGKREPQRLSSDVWDEAMKQIRESGEIPPAYRDIIGEAPVKDINGNETRGFFDAAWEAWNSEVVKLNQKYAPIAKKALFAFFQFSLEKKHKNGESWDYDSVLLALQSNIAAANSPEITETRTAGEQFFSSSYRPMWNGEPITDIIKFSQHGTTTNKFTNRATKEMPNGHTITIENIDKMQGALSVSAKKIFCAALVCLTSNNFNMAAPAKVNPTVEIPLLSYGEECGYRLTPQRKETPEEQAKEQKRVEERLKDLKRTIRRDLTNISSILWSGEVTKGKNKGDYREMRIISSHSISRGIIRINFDIDAARFLANAAYEMQYPRVLLKHDNHKPNAYSIGYKLAFHGSNDNNYAQGTNNTLSVKSLLAAASDIPTYNDIKARGQRNWKVKIKAVLESALAENVAIGLISRWEYRDPKNGKTYSVEAADALTWPQYSGLMIDFAMIDQPTQTERREAKKERTRKNRGG